jgi:hypothetical protein
MLKTVTNIINASQIATPITLPGDVTLSTGNIIQGTAAKGVNFTANTPAAGMTSQLLNSYEEGAWTPTDASGALLSFTSVTAKYTRIGRLVTISCDVTYPVNADVSQAAIGGFPFTSASIIRGIGTSSVSKGLIVSGASGATSALLLLQNATAITNTSMGTSPAQFMATYFI